MVLRNLRMAADGVEGIAHALREMSIEEEYQVDSVKFSNNARMMHGLYAALELMGLVAERGVVDLCNIVNMDCEKLY